jgi:hypothetical protein
VRGAVEQIVLDVRIVSAESDNVWLSVQTGSESSCAQQLVEEFDGLVLEGWR